jgi:hypothetical protein
MATAARNLSLILAAARTGRLGAESARKWARRAAAGEDISIVEQFAPGGPGLAPAALTALASDLAPIVLGSSAGAGRLAADMISDGEADSLFPPRSAAEAARRERTVAAAARQLAAMNDSELYGLLFTAAQGQPGAPPARFDPRPGPGPQHEGYDGGHVHEHAAYDGAGGRHAHPHTHAGDANHDHH